MGHLIERHYVSARSRSQPSVLVFLAQDASSHVFCYSNADLRKGEEAEEIFQFITFWKRAHGKLPSHLVFDSKLTTHEGLARLDAMNIPFITLRRRSPKLLKEIVLLPRSAWRTMELDVPTRKYRTPRVYEQTISLAGRSLRQIFVQDLGHDEPTILLTNQRHTPVKALLTRYAQRMLIENALSDAVRFFHIDALSSAVGLKVDFDMAMLVLASGLYRLITQRMCGYADAQARQIFRDLIDMPADVTVGEKEVVTGSIGGCKSRRPAAGCKTKTNGPTSPEKPACNARFSACEGSCRCAVQLLLRSLEMGLQRRSDGGLKIVVGFQIPVFPRQRKLIRILAVAAEPGTNQGARKPFCHLRRTDVQVDYSCCPGYCCHT
jgi:hypothetical protein